MNNFDRIKFELRHEYLLYLLSGYNGFSKLIYDVSREDSKHIADSLNIDMVPLGKKTMFYKDFEPDQLRRIDEKLDSIISKYAFDLCFETCFNRLKASIDRKTRPPNWAVVSALVVSRDDGISDYKKSFWKRQ